MNRACIRFGVIALLAGGAVALLRADDPPTTSPTTAPAALDDAARQHIAQKSARMIDALKLDDADKATRAKAIAADWLGVMQTWHAAHDAELKQLWSDWNKARSVVPKDEFPGEVVAGKIEDVYATLKPDYEKFIDRVSAELTPEQIDTLKENWSRSPGMTRTYNAYLEIVPDLSDADKQAIKARMLMAREAAMLSDSDKEVVSIYKRHKLKVEQFIGALEWQKLHKAYAAKGAAAEKKPDSPGARRGVSDQELADLIRRADELEVRFAAIKLESAALERDAKGRFIARQLGIEYVPNEPAK